LPRSASGQTGKAKNGYLLPDPDPDPDDEGGTRLSQGPACEGLYWKLWL
jgi:hypothetical protein